MNRAEYLERTKLDKGLTSDYQLARYFEITTGHLSEIKSGKRRLTPRLIALIADATGLPELTIHIDTELEKETNPRYRHFWEERRHKHAAALLLPTLLFMFCGIAPTESNATSVTYEVTTTREAASTRALQASALQEYRLCAYLDDFSDSL